MARSDDVTELVRAGLTPGEIAHELDVTVASVEGYLHRAVGEGLLRRSDIYFSVPRERRSSDDTLQRWYTDPTHALGDMYDDLRNIETTLHEKIGQALVGRYGDGEAGWWRQGVPEKVRVKCAERRERDRDNPCRPFGYSDLLDLDAILEHQWTLLKDLFPDYAPNRKDLSKDLRKLSRIRNKIMHPVRGLVPGDDEFDFVRRLKRSFGCT
ncbi:MAG: hypothetical protein DHS20C21_00650 [Gemmatimonadota bacterium]|nr:MAG: hypothetical protein DHS20C21_00650 [Gemmatimonadota bacterium]